MPLLGSTKQKLLTWGLAIVTLGGIGTYAIINRDNFHQIEAIKDIDVYRAAQLSPEELKKYIKEKSIKYILNLRGENPDKDWYRDELAVSKELGLSYYAIGFSKYAPPTRKRFLSILEVLDAAQTENANLLIHCHSGSDRSGLIAAVSEIYLNGSSAISAMKNSFNWYYGHPYNEDGVLESVLHQYHLSSKNFKDWLREDYKRIQIIENSDLDPKYYRHKHKPNDKNASAN